MKQKNLYIIYKKTFEVILSEERIKKKIFA